MSFIEVEWEDLKGNIRQLEKVKTDIENELDRIMLRAAMILEAELKVVITDMGLIDTGYMKMNIHSTVEKMFLGEVVGRVYSNTHYIKYLDEGTDRIKAYKFTEIAFYRAEPKIIKFLQRELGNIGWGRRWFY
ncbi:HK97-gp10 family putative phage morphogenesis protein [Halonatronum saccharophilum]|uniref:HK97-gp10 family putative phage morphogenesis protein n=1 Tax=Halonatronum saccharophilum TaxID=150060 RepID=UPI00047F87DF|nr:HK97-gp10 family putative phage morphogenesis protein [Halonatronum saccharophilum]